MDTKLLLFSRGSANEVGDNNSSTHRRVRDFSYSYMQNTFGVGLKTCVSHIVGFKYNIYIYICLDRTLEMKAVRSGAAWKHELWHFWGKRHFKIKSKYFD